MPVEETSTTVFSFPVPSSAFVNMRRNTSQWQDWLHVWVTQPDHAGPTSFCVFSGVWVKTKSVYRPQCAQLVHWGKTSKWHSKGFLFRVRSEVREKAFVQTENPFVLHQVKRRENSGKSIAGATMGSWVVKQSLGFSRLMLFWLRCLGLESEETKEQQRLWHFSFAANRTRSWQHLEIRSCDAKWLKAMHVSKIQGQTWQLSPRRTSQLGPGKLREPKVLKNHKDILGEAVT